MFPPWLKMSQLPLKFDAQGLVPVIVQDRVTGEIRMFAYATDAAVRKTLETGCATFWSRSRGELWQKGRASGQETPVVRVLADCDADCIIYSSDPQCPSCHSGAQSCFFQALDGDRLGQASEQPQTLLASLEAGLESSKRLAHNGGHAKALFDTGAPSLAARFREEAGKLAQALEKDGEERVVFLAADTLYHLLAGLRSRSIAVRRVLAELARRLDARLTTSRGTVPP
jgi:phosphoribosyl-AMP cyclohydrolase / phosphoribosyl-ATP pyrophosphohydrolase